MTLDELTTPLTTDEVKATIYASMAAQGVDTTTWKPGAVVRTIIAGVAIIVAALSVLIAAIARSGFLDLASGAWLTLVARYVYGVERLTGAFATSTVTVDNTAGGVYAGDPGDLVFVSTTGARYRNTATFSIAANEHGVEIPVEAIEIGTASSAAAGAINALETTLNGVNVVGSTSATGADEEIDAALRLRCREKTATLSPNGPRAAYGYVARSAKRADGTSIGVTRVRLIADGNGLVDVYVATANGDVPGTVGDLTSPLGIINNDIQTQVVPEAVTAVTHSATPVTIGVTYEVWVRDTISRSEVQLNDDIESAVGDYLGRVPIGGDRIVGESTGRVYLSAIKGVIADEIKGDEITTPLVKLIVTSPAADTDLAATEAPKAGSVVCTAMHFVASGEF